jgi:hypothetical protein
MAIKRRRARKWWVWVPAGLAAVAAIAQLVAALVAISHP